MLQIIILLSFACCITSFAWGMSRFFRIVGRLPSGARVMLIAGVISTIAHLIALCLSGGATRLTGLTSLGLYLISLALFWLAIRVNRKKPLSTAFSLDQPEHITRRGPYRFVRHPFYSSYLLAWISGAIGSAQAWLWLTVLAMVVIYYLAARMEEQKFMASSLAEEYTQYRYRTGMFIPRLWARSLVRARTRALVPFVL